MNQLISTRTAWAFTIVAVVAFGAWFGLTAAVWRLPFHPWNTVAVGFACFVTFYAWSATRPITLRLVRRFMGLWELATIVAIILAAIFGPVGQPFPRFALAIILISGGLLAAVILGCGLVNFARSLLAPRDRPTSAGR